VVIAIDGPSGAGKSTVAQAVAALIGAAYLDTGAYYRAATLAVLRAGVEQGSEDEVLATVAAADLDFQEDRMLLDGEDVSDDIRAGDVTGLVSAISAFPRVRAAIVERQREWVARHDGHAVVEGRDIGTVVFPDAPVKVFVDADSETRAMRRAGDAEAEGRPVAEIYDQLSRRDRADSTREVSPLRPASDAVIIDTTPYTADEVAAIVLRLIDPA
jgi:cytidylate kinase